MRKISAVFAGVLACAAVLGGEASVDWTACGWGGGGYFYAAAFHPERDGVIYMGGDVNGVYRTDDHGQHWRIINNGLADYGVFSLAVDRATPQTVYAATEGGLCKSVDGGEHWTLLPKTGRKDLHITGEKGKSIRCVAVDPSNSAVVYAGTPAGKVYKSVDGGQTWAVAYEKRSDGKDALNVQFGKVNDQWHAGFWLPLEFPVGLASAECIGIGIELKSDGAAPRDAFVSLGVKSGVAYRTQNIHELYTNANWQTVVLKADDFKIDAEYAKKHAAEAQAAPATPDWSTVNRVDITCVGPLMNDATVAQFARLGFASKRAPNGEAAPAEGPALWTARDFAKNKTVASYGNIRTGSLSGGTVYSVTVSAKDPALVIAATEASGLVLSEDRGKTWRECGTPRRASSAVVSPEDANVIYATFLADGVWKSADKGRTWNSVSQGLGKGVSMHEIAISPARPADLVVIGNTGWNGHCYISHDGGANWSESSKLKPDWDADPTLPDDHGKDNLQSVSALSNVTLSPRNPQEIFLSANWRPCLSTDGGRTWTEADRGADITCVSDIRFRGASVYVTAMDEGTLVSADNGAHWRALWPRKYSNEMSGHNWRVAIDSIGGAERIIAASSPWNSTNNVIVSDDGGKSCRAVQKGLPTYLPSANTMWGRGYARALAVDPKNPATVYLGIDGDPSDGHAGGGVFKSDDGGNVWRQLAHQPASRRVFYGLAVDPTDSQRLYWAACGDHGGLHCSEDGGNSWRQVFTNEMWLFNLLVSADGTIYAPGRDLWKSADHGRTWTQLTHFSGDQVIIGLEVDPRLPERIWISRTVWSGSAEGGVYRSRDGGKKWQEITGNLPYRKPMVLRFNPETSELWAGGVGLYRMKQD